MIRVSFDNLDEVTAAFDPDIVRRTVDSAMVRLRKQVATEVSKAVRKRYAIKAGEVRGALDRRTRRTRTAGGVSEGILIYTSSRLSLSRFATGKGVPTRSNRPKIKTRRGIRYGAKVKVIKGRSPKIVPGAFWGRARAGRGDDALGQGAWQIWLREGRSRNNIRRLTGPGVAHMVRSKDALEAVEQTVDRKANAILESRLDFYLGRRAGVL